MIFRFGNLGSILLSTALIAGSAIAGDNGPTESQKGDTANLTNNWTGFYVGVNGGLSDISKDIPTFDAENSSSQDPKASDVGGQAGYNLQRDHVVISLDGEVDKAFIIKRSK